MSKFRHFLFCISGYSGSGKDAFSHVLVEDFNAPKVGLADPAKRHMADLYGFTEHQLFGPSSARNAGDVRYPKPDFFSSKLTISRYSAESPPEGLQGELIPGVPYWELNSRDWSAPLKESRLPYVAGKVGGATVMVPEGHPTFWLSPRETLQKYCELMNLMYGDTWVQKSLSTHQALSLVGKGEGGNDVLLYAYDRMRGLIKTEGDHVEDAPRDGMSFFSCSADFRHKHEFRAARKMFTPNFIPVTVRVKRPSVPLPPFDHRSETEQADIPDSFFDFVVDNSGTLEDLNDAAYAILDEVRGPGWAPKRVTL